LQTKILLDQLHVNIGRMTFNQSGSMFCRDMPISSKTATIPVSGTLHPAIAQRNLDVQLLDQDINLTSGNFYVYQPAQCKIAWGFNWLIERILPYVVRAVRERIEIALETQVGDTINAMTSDITGLLQANLTWPFHFAPAKPFYATLHMWPATVKVTPQGMDFAMGSEINLDPDKSATQNLDFEMQGLSGLRLPSWIGLHGQFFDALLTESRANELFHFDVEAEDLRSGHTRLNVAHVARILPDAATRFLPRSPVRISLAGMRGHKVTVTQQANGEVLLTLSLLQAQTNIQVRGKDYFSATSNITLPLSMKHDPSMGIMGFTIGEIEVETLEGAFDQDLRPKPFLRHFDKELFSKDLQLIGGELFGMGRTFQFELPDIPLGTRTLEWQGTGVRDNFMTLEAMVR
jgi:hypothetical protein